MMRKLVIGFAAALLSSGCASSSHTIVGQVRPAIRPMEVRIYTSPPRRYQEIALLDASSGGWFPRSPEAGAEGAVERLREEAAKFGANGVLLTGVAERPGGSIGMGIGGLGFSGGRSHVSAVGGGASFGTPIMHQAARGIAIYVPGQR